ncbi:type II toxin-antitoxin system Phd/YefM family antitoxin [Luteolibacter pohnpeiensis]|uniref:Antitoxin n=1 Tax=Luteolibacter pohnpeiensis TaxID=454153 RepID=A0A934VVW9_9BACT|nr:type II toxin-antitoxin system Phd/YefM family antitoxin [Luteolibacter pohnpeiensis]MBK1881929.1 type II toxin-antitoxin system Phd/YefM family antitoxin [Luteolibacter pohnpeiensis]
MKGRTWQLQEAKNHFSEVVEQAVKCGAQTVTKHGKPTVMIVSVADFEKSMAPKKSLFAAIRECPASLSQLIGDRSADQARDLRF